MDQQKVDRLSTTRRLLDRRANPPVYLDEELPTQTKKIFSRQKQGTLWDPSVFTPGTPMVMGSMQFSGSFYETSRGTYSLRITRRSIGIGSHDYRNVEVEWALRHSREGTVEKIPLMVGTRVYNRYNSQPTRMETLGGPMNPIYSFGPGTLWSYFHHGRSTRGTLRVYSSLEGIVT